MGGSHILDQLNLLDSIKAVGTVERFLPSEFGHDIDKAEPVESGLPFYKEKRTVRRAIEAMGIPYTCICCNSIAGWPYTLILWWTGCPFRQLVLKTVQDIVSVL